MSLTGRHPPEPYGKMPSFYSKHNRNGGSCISTSQEAHFKCCSNNTSPCSSSSSISKTQIKGTQSFLASMMFKHYRIITAAPTDTMQPLPSSMHPFKLQQASPSSKQVPPSAVSDTTQEARPLTILIFFSNGNQSTGSMATLSLTMTYGTILFPTSKQPM